MKIAVIGAGAIGSLLAGYLAEKNEQVTLIARPAQASVLSRDGLIIEGVRERKLIKLPIGRRLDQKADLVILATKTQDLEKAISENLAYLEGARILTIQNGIRAEKIVAERIGSDNLFSSIVMFGVTYLAPGKIIHNFEGDWILGRSNSATEQALAEIRKVSSKIFPSPLSDDIMGMKWLKLFLNANNCLPALLGKSMQETFKNISICRISLRIWQEGWELVSKAGIKMASLPNFSLERITQLISLPPDTSARIFSDIMTNLSKAPLYGSILQSIWRGRPSEIDYINGEFINLAVSIGQSAPLNKKLVQMVHSVEENKQFFQEEKLINQTKQFLN